MRVTIKGASDKNLNQNSDPNKRRPSRHILQPSMQNKPVIPDHPVNPDGSNTKHVLMVSGGCCIRVRKQAQALRDRGWIVDSLSVRDVSDPNPFHQAITTQYAHFDYVIENSKASIIHVHNEPDFMMRNAVKSSNGRRVIYDCHDLEFWRYKEVTDDERFAFENADAIIHVSKGQQAKAQELHPYDCPEIIVPSAVPRSWAPCLNGAKRSGVVLQGGVTRRSANSTDHMDHLNYHPVDKLLHEEGIGFTIYPASPRVEKIFWNDLRDPQPYVKLLEKLSTYQYGFTGACQPNPKWMAVLPNKMFEYLSCGTPIICMNAPDVKDFLDGKAGIYCDRLEDLPDMIRNTTLDQWNYLQAEALSAPVFMEDYIEEVEKLYTGV